MGETGVMMVVVVAVVAESKKDEIKQPKRGGREQKQPTRASARRKGA